MVKSRKKLREMLIRILSSVDMSYKKDHLYFRKPSGKLNYPCILYNRSGDDPKFSDNIKYINHDRYTITVIDEDEDSPIAEGVNSLAYCNFDRSFETDGLNHFVYTIYV